MQRMPRKKDRGLPQLPRYTAPTPTPPVPAAPLEPTPPATLCKEDAQAWRELPESERPKWEALTDAQRQEARDLHTFWRRTRHYMNAMLKPDRRSSIAANKDYPVFRD